MREFFSSFAEQLAQQAPFDIDDVVRALGQIDVFQVLKDFCEAPQRSADGVFGRVMFLPNQPLDLREQFRIAQDLEMGGEDGTALFAKLRRDRVTIAGNLSGDGVDCVVQPLQFVIDGVAHHKPPGDAKSLVIDDQCFANGNAWRNRDSLQRSHGDVGGDRSQPLRASIMIRLSVA